MLKTPLHGAASNGHVDCVWLLLNSGANTSAKEVRWKREMKNQESVSYWQKWREGVCIRRTKHADIFIFLLGCLMIGYYNYNRLMYVSWSESKRERELGR